MKRSPADDTKEKHELLDELLDFAKGGMAKEMRARHGIEPEDNETRDSADLEAEDPGAQEAAEGGDAGQGEEEENPPGDDGEGEDLKSMLRRMAASG